MIRPLASYRALPLLPTAIVTGVIVTCALVTLAFQNEIAHEKNVFISQSHLIHEGVARRVTATEEVARSLALLFNASTQVDADEFRLFADDTLERLPFVRSVLYLPLVQDRDRRAFERGMREKGYETFSIKERRQDGPATAPRHDSPQCDVQHHHDGKAHDGAHRRQIGIAFALRLGDGLLDHNKNHGPGGKRQRIRQQLTC